jgi:segregation and condensation protein B
LAEAPPPEQVATGAPLLEQITPEADPDALDPTLALPRGDEVLAVLEALLFAATTPLTVKRLSVLMNGVPEPEIEFALVRLRERCSLPTSGLALMEVGGGWQLATSPDVADWVLRLHRHRKRNPLTPSLLECLAIIAYKQPITRADIEAIRGVDCGTALRSLQDAGLCEIVGRKEVLGRPPLYGTTELFLKTFGLKDIEGLPSMGELRSVVLAQGTEGTAIQPAPPEASPTDAS